MSLFQTESIILLAGLAAGAASALQPEPTAEVNGHNAPLTVEAKVPLMRTGSLRLIHQNLEKQWCRCWKSRS